MTRKSRDLWELKRLVVWYERNKKWHEVARHRSTQVTAVLHIKFSRTISFFCVCARANKVTSFLSSKQCHVCGMNAREWWKFLGFNNSTAWCQLFRSVVLRCRLKHLTPMHELSLHETGVRSRWNSIWFNCIFLSISRFHCAHSNRIVVSWIKTNYRFQLEFKLEVVLCTTTTDQVCNDGDLFASVWPTFQIERIDTIIGRFGWEQNYWVYSIRKFSDLISSGLINLVEGLKLINLHCNWGNLITLQYTLIIFENVR